MNNIENQMELLGRTYKQTRCPKTRAEIDQAIANAMATKRRSARGVWPWAAAAAVAAAIVVPTALSMSDKGVKTIKVGNDEVYFCCNSDCDAESTIEMFNSLIH